MNLNYDRPDPEDERQRLLALNDPPPGGSGSPPGNPLLAVNDRPFVRQAPAIPTVTPDGDPPPPTNLVDPLLSPRPDPLAVVDPNAPAPPRTSSSNETERTQVHHVISPEEAETQDQLQKVNVEEQKLAGKAGVIAKDQARIKEEAAADAVAQAHANKAVKDKIVADGVADWRRVNDDWQTKKAAYANAKPKDFYADDPKGERRLWAGIAMALGGFNSRVMGGRNLGYEMIRDSIASFGEKEKARILKLKGAAENAKDEFGMVDKRKKDALADLAVQMTAMSDVAADELTARLSAQGVPSEEIKTNATVVALRKDALDEKAKHFKGARDEIHERTISRAGESAGGPAADGAGRAATTMIRHAEMASQLKDDFENYRKEGGEELSEEAKLRIQKNDHLIHSQGDSTVAAWGRGIVPGSIVPTSRYDGLSKADAAKANSLRLMAEKAASIMYTAGGEKSMDQLVREFDATVPGSNSEQKLENILHVTNVAAEHGGKYTQQAEAGKKKGYAGQTPSGKDERPKTPVPASPKGPNKTELQAKAAEAIKWVRDNPTSPQVPEIKKRIAEFLKAAK